MSLSLSETWRESRGEAWVDAERRGPLVEWAARRRGGAGEWVLR